MAALMPMRKPSPTMLHREQCSAYLRDHSCCNYCDMLLMKNSTLATSPGFFVACSDCSGKPLKLPANSNMRLCKLIHTRNFLEETFFKPPAWPISDKTEPCMLITCAYFHEPPANDSLLTDRLLRTCRHLGLKFSNETHTNQHASTTKRN